MSAKQKARTKSAPSKSRSYSNLGEHHQTGKTLQPPLKRLDKITSTSWQDDHLPSVLWAALLTQALKRTEYLECFRHLAKVSAPWFEDSGPLARKNIPTTDPTIINFTSVLDFDSLAELPDKEFSEFLTVVRQHTNQPHPLRPLLLLTSLPSIDRWRGLLGAEPEPNDWEQLADAVAHCLDHQSEASTDIRWFKLLVPILAGRMRFGVDLQDRVKDILEFPNRGDLRSVRPSIRAAEVSMRRNPSPPWVRNFWDECVGNTGCIDPTDIQAELKRSPPALDPRNVMSCRMRLIDRFFEVKSSERVDARLDTSFGLALYALSTLTTVLGTRNQETMLGRLAIRSIVEARITLAFLAKKDDLKVWTQWRVYGSGQVKLAFLKTQEAVGDQPTFYDADDLYQLANEDTWQEFLDIDLGHWTKGNLRWMATESGIKDLYDQYYNWSSGFVHAQWGAVRDTDFVTCHNPLHRLHRIPRAFQRRQASVERDAADLVNGLIDLVDTLYPGGVPLDRLKNPLADKPSAASGEESKDPTPPANTAA